MRPATDKNPTHTILFSSISSFISCSMALCQLPLFPKPPQPGARYLLHSFLMSGVYARLTALPTLDKNHLRFMQQAHHRIHPDLSDPTGWYISQRVSMALPWPAKANEQPSYATSKSVYQMPPLSNSNNTIRSVFRQSFLSTKCCLPWSRTLSCPPAALSCFRLSWP